MPDGTRKDAFVVPDAALAEHAAIVGRTGSGKTYTAKGFVERLLEQLAHVVIIDPTGVWWGLRSSASGKKAAFPVVVFGGDRADVPITDKVGHQLAEIIVAERLSCVVDVSGFSNSGCTRFLADFLETLYARSRAPLNLVLDEADTVAPQRPMPDQTILLNRAEAVVRRGRARGLRCILITQRPAVLNKNVLTQVGMLIALKLTSPQDRDALGAWIEGQADRDAGRDVIASLPKLQPGEGWVWWPAGDVLQRTVFPRIATFDSSSTPILGQTPSAQVLAPVKIDALRAAFAPAEKSAPAGAGAAADAQAAAIREALARGRTQAREAARARIETLEERIRFLEAVIQRAARTLEAKEAPAGPPAAPPALPQPEAPPTPPKPAAQPLALGRSELRVLAVLASRHPAMLTEAQWATLAGMKRTGGAWNSYKGKLRSNGMVELWHGRLWRCTDLGLQEISLWLDQGPIPVPNTPDELLQTWRRAVGTGPGRMLDALAASPDGLTRAQLAGALGMSMTGGAFNGYLSRLRDNDLVEERKGHFRLAEILR